MIGQAALWEENRTWSITHFRYQHMAGHSGGLAWNVSRSSRWSSPFMRKESSGKPCYLVPTTSACSAPTWVEPWRNPAQWAWEDGSLGGPQLSWTTQHTSVVPAPPAGARWISPASLGLVSGSPQRRPVGNSAVFPAFSALMWFVQPKSLLSLPAP